MSRVEIYTKDYCPYSKRAKQLLSGKGIEFEEFDVTHDVAGQQEMIERSGRRTVPQIFIDGVHIGGSDDLADYDRSGALDRLLQTAA